MPPGCEATSVTKTDAGTSYVAIGVLGRLLFPIQGGCLRARTRPCQYCAAVKLSSSQQFNIPSCQPDANDHALHADSALQMAQQAASQTPAHVRARQARPAWYRIKGQSPPQCIPSPPAAALARLVRKSPAAPTVEARDPSQLPPRM
eukprot:CAMPEP_0181252236 /NCGR_PEP_ID=MMETSP1096-20121128/47352_1 /TAXON_ID=156174 ORGANISM="Chrysochromulina ericina, Strain CCMP281" /NCGR_SAMPLE_ID=MMETSP1096 /ASSEMBLY_ACC=CAM_ASM_000453 /LENGTH=146 /DNA_ID=CAMNT_0023349971 /DNA_START=192 /DNA_END=633 /DNA_ORIENTATION=+